MYRKKLKYNIGKKAADETLKNIFAACDQKPNDKSLEVIRVWTIANTTVVKVCFYISILALVLILLSPLAFRNQENTHFGINSQKKYEVEVVSHHMDNENNCFVMVIKGQGVDYNGIYGKMDNGKVVFPSSIDKITGEVRIPFTEGNLNIFIPKEDGTTTQAVLSR